MIRQLGPASLFCSFSSAETKWNHLLRILGNLIDHKNYSEEELNNLTWDDRCRLIQSDPVTCTRHFDFQFNTFLKDVLTSELAPVGKVKDWFYRVEYQRRGSPHIHMLIWLRGASVFGVDKDEDVVAYIDSIIPVGNLITTRNYLNLYADRHMGILIHVENKEENLQI